MLRGRCWRRRTSDFAWPRSTKTPASTICYTSGTTGNPKGVVYSHRAAMLQTLLAGSFDFLPGHRSGVREVMMPMAPMFHGNAWNFPFLAPYTGSKLVLPGRNYEPEKLYELLEGEQVDDHLRRAELLAHPHSIGSTARASVSRSCACTLSCGSAPPRA